MSLAALVTLCIAGVAVAQQSHHHGGGHGYGGAYSGGRGGYGGEPASRMSARTPSGGWGGGGPPPGGFDPRQHNGYWVGPHWHYGPPSGPVIRVPGYRPGYAPWRPGAYLPPQYQGYVVEDYWNYRLRRPPYGFHWVRAGNELLLISMSTGQIFDVVTGF